MNIQVEITGRSTCPFLRKNNIYQDGTTPMYRDVDGTLWAMSGHSHMGHIGMFAGKTLEDLEHKYPIQTNFCVGHADYAYDKIKYPDGVKARGSIWPFGLYICPNTHRFFCFFHNEAGWNGQGTGYDALGYSEKPAYDSDFRHVGLMHSDDEGKHWIFDRWVLSAEEVCFTERFNPDGINVKGQPEGIIGLGSGDFSIFVEPEGEYIYLFYNIVRADMKISMWDSCDVYVARTRKRTDGIMGDFVKYYNGAFCEAGNFGKETKLIDNAWHPRVLWLENQKKYMMAACQVIPSRTPGIKNVKDVAQLRFSEDLVNWSEPIYVEYAGKPFGNHYVAAVHNDGVTQPHIATTNNISFLTNHNGTDVDHHTAVIIEE